MTKPLDSNLILHGRNVALQLQKSRITSNHVFFSYFS